MEEQRKIIMSAMIRQLQQVFANLDGVGIGSDHVSKDDIIRSVSRQAVDARNFMGLCLSAISSLEAGYTIEEWMDHELDSISSDSRQPEGDKIAKRRDLDMLTQEILNLI